MFTALKEFTLQYGAQIVAFAFFAYIVIQLTRLALVKGSDLWEGIKGENGVLDPEDFAILMWTILFPVLVLSDVFLGLKAGDNIWWSMDAILAIVLGYKGWGKNGHDNGRKDKGKEGKSETDKDDDHDSSDLG